MFFVFFSSWTKKKKELEVEVGLERRPELVVTHLYARPASYFVFAGLVFTVLTRPFLQSEYGREWPKKAPIELCDYAFHGVKETNEHEVFLVVVVVVVVCVCLC